MSDEKKSLGVETVEGQCPQCGHTFVCRRDRSRGSTAFVSVDGRDSGPARRATAIATGPGSAASVNGSATAGNVIYEDDHYTIVDRKNGPIAIGQILAGFGKNLMVLDDSSTS